MPQNSLGGTLSSKVNAGQANRFARRRRSAAWLLGIPSVRQGKLLLGGVRVLASLCQLDWAIIFCLYSPGSFT